MVGAPDKPLPVSVFGLIVGRSVILLRDCFRWLGMLP
jgi:hypothetical protein